MNVGNIIYLNCEERYEVRPEVVRTGRSLQRCNTTFQWTVFTVALLIFLNYTKCLHKRTHFPNEREYFSGGSSTLTTETSSAENTQY